MNFKHEISSVKICKRVRDFFANASETTIYNTEKDEFMDISNCCFRPSMMRYVESGEIDLYDYRCWDFKARNSVVYTTRDGKVLYAEYYNGLRPSIHYKEEEED